MVVNDIFWRDIQDYRSNAKKRSKHLSLSDRALDYIEAVIDILERDMAMPKIDINDSMLIEGLVTIMYNNLPKEATK